MSQVRMLPRAQSETGFTLVELMIAIVVIVVGVLAMSSVTATTIRQQDVSAARTDMAALADNKFEDLRGFAGAVQRTADTMQLVPGGNLAADVANYNDTVTERGRTYTRRWIVTAGVGGTRDVTIRIIPPAMGPRTPQSKDFFSLITM
jgi:prepilin-type N-terminal cleavage/methylation domain-containing protein